MTTQGRVGVSRVMTVSNSNGLSIPVAACMNGRNAAGESLTDSGTGQVANLGAGGYDTVDYDTDGITTGHGLADGQLKATRTGLWAVFGTIDVTADANAAVEFRESLTLRKNSLPTGRDAVALVPKDTVFLQPDQVMSIYVEIVLTKGDLMRLQWTFDSNGATVTATAYAEQFGMRWLGPTS